MNNRWSISILMPIFLAHSTCYTASIIQHDSVKKDICTPTPPNKPSYDDRRHWLTIVACLEQNPHDTPTLEGWTVYNQSRDISRKIVCLRENLSLGSKKQTPEQRIQAQWLAHAIKPSLMKKDSPLWKKGHNLYLEKKSLSLLQQNKYRNPSLEQTKQKKIQTLELTIVKLATETMVTCLAEYVANQKKLENITQGKKP